MTKQLLDFAREHPWWTLVYLLISAGVQRIASFTITAIHGRRSKE